MVQIVTPHVARSPARLKLPAYGKALLARRRAGEHPLCVHLIIGNDWRAPCVCTWCALGDMHPLLAIKPEDCQPGRFAWGLTAGLNVVLFDQQGLALDFKQRSIFSKPYDYGPLYAVIGEIARHAADIEISAPGWRTTESAYLLAWSGRDYRFTNDVEHNHGWPCWWSAETEVINAQRRQTWLRAVDERDESTAAASV